MNLCTLFNTDYLDKLLVMYHSLANVSDDFKLYCLCMDKQSATILKQEKLREIIVIELSEVENEDLATVKTERSFAEYCWTLTPYIIDYVLKTYRPDSCTYIDADLFFYQNPKVLINEIENTKKNIIITEHRFPLENREKMVKMSGKYCVQFNYFSNSPDSIRVLESWKQDTLAMSKYTRNGDQKGDQKYLEKWPLNFNNIHELQHLGGGMAPWNVSQYELINKNNLTFKFNERQFDLVFYHFQGVKYLPLNIINCNLPFRGKNILDVLYVPYLTKIRLMRKYLEKTYGIKFHNRLSVSNNPLLRFYQRYISPFRVRHISNLIRLRKVKINDTSQ